MSIRRSLGALLVLAAPLGAAAQGHEHGAATLDIALDGNTLLISMESPLDSLVGFEHAPRNDRQRAALARMEASLRDAGRLFKPTAEAGCTPREAKVEQPFAGKTAGEAAPAHGEEKKEAAKHDADHHAETRVTWTFVCDRPQALRAVEVLLFDAFPRMQRIKAQAATPRGQSGAMLTRK